MDKGFWTILLFGMCGLVQGNERITVLREGYLGLTVDSVPPVVYSQNPELLPKGQGVLVVQVVKDSAAAHAGLQPNDILLTYGDQRLYSPEQLVKLVRADKPGQQVVLNFARGGKMLSCKVGLGEIAQPVVSEQMRAFRLFPDERLRKWFLGFEAKLEETFWEPFASVKMSRLAAPRWRADIDFRTKEGKRIVREYVGTRDEIRAAIHADKDLSEQEKTQLLRALNLHYPIIEFNAPSLAPARQGWWNQP